MQKVVSLSTTKVEYVVATKASKEMIWLQRFMEELERRKRIVGCTLKTRVPFILQRTQPSILKTKHIHLRYHFIRSVLEDGHLKLEKIHTSQNHVDMLTKGVTREKLSSFLVSVGLQA
jgi:hypothetical protein